KLQDYVNKLQDSAQGFGEIFNQLPFVDGKANGSIAEITGLTSAVSDLVTKAKAALDNGDTTLSDVVTELNGLTVPGSPFDVWSLAVTTSYRGSDPDATDATGSLEFLLDFDLHAEINNQKFALDLGQEGAALGVSIPVNLMVDASLDGNFSVGISTGTPVE